MTVQFNSEISYTPGQDNLLLIKLCDNSLVTQSWATTQWGNMEARENFYKFVDAGNENDALWSRPPHVRAVVLWMANVENEAREDFLCPCSKKEEAHG